MSHAMSAGLSRRRAGTIAPIDEGVIDESGPIGSGQTRLVVSTKAYGPGDAVTLTAGVFQAVGRSRPLANDPHRYATTVIHIA
jgi:hypothetical protein